MIKLKLTTNFVSFLTVVLIRLIQALIFQDDNRYNSSRGAHLNLKRAEKARILVNKIPGIIEHAIN